MNSTLVEDYLKTIYLLSHTDEPAVSVSTSDLARRLGVPAATASMMLQRLARPALDLLEYTPYHGVRLTPHGERLALRVIRRHRLLELYLAEHLGLPWDEVHGEAERLEHHISAALEARIAAALGDPQVDPHGHPIPTASGELSAPPGRPLPGLLPGQPAVILSVQDDDPDLLRYLATRGLYPGVPVVVVGREPFGGALVLRVGAAPDSPEQPLGLQAAAAVRVTGPAAVPEAVV